MGMRTARWKARCRDKMVISTAVQHIATFLVALIIDWRKELTWPLSMPFFIKSQILGPRDQWKQTRRWLYPCLSCLMGETSWECSASHEVPHYLNAAVLIFHVDHLLKHETLASFTITKINYIFFCGVQWRKKNAEETKNSFFHHTVGMKLKTLGELFALSCFANAKCLKYWH